MHLFTGLFILWQMCENRRTYMCRFECVPLSAVSILHMILFYCYLHICVIEYIQPTLQWLPVNRYLKAIITSVWSLSRMRWNYRVSFWRFAELVVQAWPSVSQRPNLSVEVVWCTMSYHQHVSDQLYASTPTVYRFV